MQERTKKRVVMVKRVASSWVARKVQAEHRFSVFLGSKEIRNLPNLLRSFRDGKVVLSGVPPFSEFGISEEGDRISLWSSNREAMKSLMEWFEVRGFETTGVW